MQSPKYESLSSLSHREAETKLNSSDPEQIATALVALSLHDSDWKWVQQQCLRFLSHESEVVVSAAIVSLGHTARVNRKIDKEIVIQALQSVATDPRYTGKVEDAAGDIAQFVKNS